MSGTQATTEQGNSEQGSSSGGAAPVAIEPVRTWSQRRAFFHLPWRIYTDYPLWVPPLRGNLKELLGWKRHPFYEHARIELFLARRGGQVVGRIGAIIDEHHNERYQERRGFFGFFESIDDKSVSRALLGAAWDWLQAEGMDCLRGPANPSMNHECGLLVEGFDSAPSFMLTYNPPYYAALFEDFGLRKAMDLLAYEGNRTGLPWVEGRLDSIVESAIERFKVKIRHLDRSRFQQDVEMFLELYNRGMEGNWGFVPLPAGEVKAIAATLKHLLIPELALAAEIEGEPVGVVLGLPDYNPAIRRIDGRLFPLGFLEIFKLRRHPKRVRVLSIAVVPEYQMWGLGLVLMKALVPHALERGVDEAEFSWILETNRLACGSLDKAGAKIAKRYRMYDYPSSTE